MKRSRNLTRLWIGLIVVVILGLSALTYANYRFVQQNPGGNDFLVHWMGTRVYVTEGISPYSDQAAERIQTYAYGRPAQAGEHELRFAYPLYSIVLFLPFALIPDFAMARAIWMTVLEAGLVAISLLSVRVVDWRPGVKTMAAFLLFSLLWYHGVRPLINGNAVILVALCIVGGLLAMRAKADELAGVLFAFATIKPHVALLFILFVAIWSLAHHRPRVVGWLAATVFLLGLSAVLLMPDWILQNIGEILRYPAYNPPGTLRTALIALLPGIGNRLGLAITGVLAVVLIFEWWLSTRTEEYRHFLWTACLTLVVAQWIGIQTDPGNFIVTMPAIVLIFTMWEERWHRGGRIVSLSSMLLLLVTIWGIFLLTVQYGDQPVQSPVMFLPLPAFLLFGLYWVRWWAIRPPNVWFDSIYVQENRRL
ncbi:MAG: glycosyltransferase family 87 protein [Anaerolineaceae bacterium]|nr:glycosyltransferase family 87 protein [Anaerolineaceae bacterium]